MSDPVDIANTLNEYFCKIGQSVPLETNPTENALPKSKCSIQFAFSPVPEATV